MGTIIAIPGNTRPIPGFNRGRDKLVLRIGQKWSKIGPDSDVWVVERLIPRKTSLTNPNLLTVYLRKKHARKNAPFKVLSENTLRMCYMEENIYKAFCAGAELELRRAIKNSGADLYAFFDIHPPRRPGRLLP